MRQQEDNMKENKLRRVISILTMLFLVVGILYPVSQGQAATKSLKVHYIDVGQSDCVLVEYGNKSMLIDAGDTDDTDTILKYLKKQNIKELDYLILTHPHADHIGSASDIIKKYPVGKIIMPKVEHTTKTYENLLKTIAKKNLKITKPVVGTTYKLGKANFTIIAPNSYKHGSNLNNYSIGIKLTYQKNSFVFIGDSEIEAISDIVSNGIDLSADVYMCGHHGSKTSTTKKLLKAIKPKYAIISVGKNSYGHPNDSTLKLLSENKIKTYRTDKSGTIVVKSDGKKISINAKPSTYKPSSSSNTTTDNNSNNNSGTSNIINKTYVYITETGSKYHIKGCRYLKNSMIKIKLTNAKKQGYDPCSVCN